MRRGATLIELAMVLSLIAIITAIVWPRAGALLDRLAVSRAASEIVAFYHRARFAAIYRAHRVRIELDRDSLRATFEAVRDSTFLIRPGPGSHGVDLTASRPVIRVHPNGVGWGAANTKLVLRRGVAAESLTTSLLGRLKRWR